MAVCCDSCMELHIYVTWNEKMGHFAQRNLQKNSCLNIIFVCSYTIRLLEQNLKAGVCPDLGEISLHLCHLLEL